MKLTFGAHALASILFFPAALLGAPVDGRDGGDQPPPRIRVESDLVVIKAAVTDPLNRYVTGLGKEHFKVYEGKVQQAITHFVQEATPVSVGIIFDISGSMKEHIASARQSVTRFLEQGNPDDEFFLVTFNERTALVQDFTNRTSNIQNAVSFRAPGGRTALYDAAYLGLQKITEAQYDKKALIIITDGEDNSSRYSFGEVKEFAKEMDAQIYAIGEEGKLEYGRSIVMDLVSLTGGRAFFPNNFSELDYYCDLIHTELRNQYVLGYISTNRAKDGKWRDVRVKLDPPEGLPKLKVRAKEGYYAPKK